MAISPELASALRLVVMLEVAVSLAVEPGLHLAAALAVEPSLSAESEALFSVRSALPLLPTQVAVPS